MSTDSVNSPKHYNSHPSGVECITITEHMNFNVGNAVKYLWRAGLKQDPDKAQRDKHIEDLEKAAWYVNREIRRLRHQAAEAAIPDLLGPQAQAADLAAHLDQELVTDLMRVVDEVISGKAQDPLADHHVRGTMPELYGNEARIHARAMKAVKQGTKPTKQVRKARR